MSDSSENTEVFKTTKQVNWAPFQPFFCSNIPISKDCSRACAKLMESNTIMLLKFNL